MAENETAVRAVEAVELSGAEVVAGAAVGAVEITAATVVGEVAEVREELADHAEASEERHEEILEGELWLRTRLEQLLTTAQSLQAQFSALQAAQETEFRTIREVLNLMSRNSSTASSQLSPQEQAAPAAPMAEPGSAEGAPQVPPERQVRKRPVI